MNAPIWRAGDAASHNGRPGLLISVRGQNATLAVSDPDLVYVDVPVDELLRDVPDTTTIPPFSLAGPYAAASRDLACWGRETTQDRILALEYENRRLQAELRAERREAVYAQTEVNGLGADLREAQRRLDRLQTILQSRFAA